MVSWGHRNVVFNKYVSARNFYHQINYIIMFDRNIENYYYFFFWNIENEWWLLYAHDAVGCGLA